MVGELNLEFRGVAWTANRRLGVVSSRWLLELQNQQRLTGERMYSEEERGALTSNGWVEEDGPEKGAKECLQSGRETRAVYVTEIKGRERLKKQELVNGIGCR